LTRRQNKTSPDEQGSNVQEYRDRPHAKPKRLSRTKLSKKSKNKASARVKGDQSTSHIPEQCLDPDLRGQGRHGQLLFPEDTVISLILGVPSNQTTSGSASFATIRARLFGEIVEAMHASTI
jgi:hypothetical protein